jgi:spore coat protein CotH
MKRYLNKISALVGVVILSSGLHAQSGQDMFDETYVHEIQITFDDPNFWDSLTMYYDDMLMSGADKKYMMASGVVIDGNVLDSVGVRQKGFFSNWGAFGSNKKPLKIDFGEYKDRKYDGLKKINLANGFRDPSMLRDVMAYRVFRTMGLRAPRTSYAKVYINNQYWGLYIVVEQVDSEFIEDNFPGNSDGNLYSRSLQKNFSLGQHLNLAS